MLFNSYIFVLFFSVFIIFYVLLRHRLDAQNLLIILGSYFFYGWWDERFLILIMVSTCTDFVTALGITKQKPTLSQAISLSLLLLIGAVVLMFRTWNSTSWTLIPLAGWVGLAWLTLPRLFDLKNDVLRRRIFLIISIVTNLGILGFFKYFNFFVDSFQQAVAMLGWEVDPITLNIILPVGVSFYTFQTMSYSIDVYRQQISPTHKFTEFAAYLVFFPQLVAGPIERASHLLPQFQRLRTMNLDDMKSGAWLCVWGLYQKIVIADNLAPLANKVFTDPSAASSGELLTAILAFTFQIYCDFSGYSDMARGLARILGFDIMVNFNVPYLAKTPSEFWRRWHISLSSWLKDYLYISLGGNRYGTWFTYRNLLLTMLLGGLWHGAAWNFFFWGAYQGLILVIYRFLQVDIWLANRTGPWALQRLQDLILTIIMFILICFGWLLFRSSSLSTIPVFISGFTEIAYSPKLATLAFYLWPLLLYQGLQWWRNHLEPLTQLPWFVRFNVQLLVIYSLIFISSRGGSQFIYFNF